MPGTRRPWALWPPTRLCVYGKAPGTVQGGGPGSSRPAPTPPVAPATVLLTLPQQPAPRPRHPVPLLHQFPDPLQVMSRATATFPCNPTASLASLIDLITHNCTSLPYTPTSHDFSGYSHIFKEITTKHWITAQCRRRPGWAHWVCLTHEQSLFTLDLHHSTYCKLQKSKDHIYLSHHCVLGLSRREWHTWYLKNLKKMLHHGKKHLSHALHAWILHTPAPRYLG